MNVQIERQFDKNNREFNLINKQIRSKLDGSASTQTQTQASELTQIQSEERNEEN